VAAAELAAWMGRAPAAQAELLAPDERVLATPGQSAGWIGKAVLDAAEAAVKERLDRHHREQPLQHGLAKAELQPVSGLEDAAFQALLNRAEAAGVLRTNRQLVAMSGHVIELSPEEEKASGAVLAAHATAGLHAPDLAEVLSGTGLDEARSRRLVQLLIEEGRLLKLKEGMLVSVEAMAGLVDDMASWYSGGEAFAVPDFKDRCAVSRKHAIPLLEHLDARGLTRRQGDGRVWVGPASESAEGSPR
jgi:selenocysteine-specific elongation factor